MKRHILGAAVTVILCLVFTQSTSAQDQWLHGKKAIYSVGVGGTRAINVGGPFRGGTTVGPWWGGGLWGARLAQFRRLGKVGVSIHASGEYKVWEYISAGWQVGVQFFPYTGTLGIGIPISARVNAHIFDALNLGIADKLDVYAGLNFGGGPAFFTNAVPGSSRVYGIIHVGPQAGARYWFSDALGVFVEVGWGASFASAGLSF